MTRDEIVRAIRESPLTEEDINYIIGQCTRINIGRAMIAAGMDMTLEERRAEERTEG